ncbi:MAG: cob(I)yrinic acid a,c-diamide adenosyltransferase [Candidatus Izemoplasmataceae bacterium]|jgi:cob(I)alamin adenosyltransferase|uniref:cob(I)yrinic acid a,c-diamide adenosyltransferase n=1 Tax=Liberiplasma polymorphum TaxID=3374570 RepID=UPI003772D4CD
MHIKDIKQISTKKGDSGTSRNYSNDLYSKDDVLFDTLGTMDELSSFLGLTFHYTNYEKIKTIQATLQAINALIATNVKTHKETYDKLRHINEKDIQFIEEEEQTLLSHAPIEPRFFLPGSEASIAGAYFDLARAICRRAERMLVKFINTNEREDLSFVRQYLNRLSDLLFILARNF